MSNHAKELGQLLSLDIFKKVLNSEIITIAGINAITTFLIKGNIPFSLSFSSGTTNFAAAAQLTINITPTTTVTFVLRLEDGPTIFDAF